MDELKTTNFSSSRFIIPKEWFENIINDSKSGKKFTNSIFLNTKKNKLKSKIDTNKIILVVFEIMQYIISNFEVDYIILVQFDSNKKIVDFENVEIFSTDNFNLYKQNYDRINIEHGYLQYPEFSVINNNNSYLGDSTNKLLNEPRQFFNLEKNNEKGKDDSTTIKRINTDSENNSNKNINYNINENIQNSQYNNEKNEKENDIAMDTDELNKNEKFHNINQMHYRNLSLKNLNGDDIKTVLKGKNKCEIQNKENEKEKEEGNKETIANYKKEEIKKYLFNDSQLSINLENFEGQSLKPIGLFNPSIYCFMICILQALLSIPELNYFFLSRFYLKNYSKNSKNENETVLCEIFHDFIQSYMFGKKYIEIPKILRTVCIRLLGGMRMHDCQEFFVCFLEALQDELNNKEKMNVPENASMKLRWTLYRQINKSFIDSIFTGLMRSSVQCRKCNYKSYTYDPFIDLSVSINKYKNLEKCLKQYFENEKMDCEYKCDKCKQVSKVSKFKYLNRIIHLGK